MDPDMEEMLRKMGWSTGLQIPLANKENKFLQNEVEKLMMKKVKAKQFHETEESRFNSIENHLKFVKQQNLENQNLLTTYRQHLDSQEHKFLLTQSEKASVQQETRKIEKDRNDLDARITTKKGDLDKGMSKMEKMKTESNWDNEALLAWEESLKKRDEDNELLKKFSREDEKKAKELEAKRQNLQTELIARKQTLDKLIGDLTNYEHILERTGKIFKQQRDERAALINQWQEAVKSLRQRDEVVENTIRDIEITQELLAQEQEKFDEQNNFLNNEINNNKEIELKIAELNFNSSKLRGELNELVQFVLTLNSEAATLKRSLLSTANFLEKERLNSKNLMKDIEFKDLRIKQLQNDIHNLQKKFNNVRNSSMSAADRAKQLEEMIQFEQRQSNVVVSDSERMQGALFRTQQSFNKLKDDAKVMEMEIAGCETATNLLKKHSQKTHDNLQKQKEINYDLDFRINQMQSKLDKLEGATVDEDKEARLEKINELDKYLSDENEIKQMLQVQVDHIEDEMRRLSSAIQSDNDQLETIKGKLQSEVLAFEGGIKQTVIAKQRSQQRQVDENILRLRVNQLEKIMKREDYNIYTLQKYRLELEMAMRERQIEINTNKEILFVKRRNLDEEKGRLKRDIGARHIKIDQLQKRFYISMMALGKDEDGQPLSVTHFKIKNAQEKYMLQQEGDELDIKVKRTEKEIIAMENTLRIIHSSNVAYKQSLSAVGEFDQETEEMNLLENEISNITAIVRQRRKDIIVKKHEVKDLKLQLSTADVEKVEAQTNLNATLIEHDDLQRYSIDQRIKIDRADRHLHTCMKNLDPRVTLKYHKNLVIRQLQEANKSALQQLVEASTRYQDMTPNIGRYLSDYNLRLPGPRLVFTPRSCSSESSRSSEYYASGPYVSKLLLEFDPKSPPTGGNRSAPSKSTKRKIQKTKF